MLQHHKGLLTFPQIVSPDERFHTSSFWLKCSRCEVLWFSITHRIRG